MLGWIGVKGRGAADAVLADVADRLLAEGWPLAGAVQVNRPNAPGRKVHMDLRVLGTDRTIRISQDLGAGSAGCRLDPQGLEAAAGLSEAALARGPRLALVNKFGKQEIDGRGFRPFIGLALAQDIPVLCAVSAANVAGFAAFADGMATRLPARVDPLLDWARAVAAVQVTGAAPVA